MDEILSICNECDVVLLEDAAQALHSYYKGKPLGSYGAMSAFSFHETKNVNCGEGGLLVINDNKYVERAEIIREKGTNRSAFFKGEVQKYQWVDMGSSYLLSDILAAYLHPQLDNIEAIMSQRKTIWKTYYDGLRKLDNCFDICQEDEKCTGNYHIFYLVFFSSEKLVEVKALLKRNNILSATHYVPLHMSEFYRKKFGNKELPNAEKFGSRILRLPLYNGLDVSICKDICRIIRNYTEHNIVFIKHSNIAPSDIDKIINLKSQFWHYPKDSQLEWIRNNIKEEDSHVLLFEDGQLIGYGSIMHRACNIIDGVIIDENYRNKGHGGRLISCTNEYIKNNGFLLCEDRNIGFYKKCGWTEDNDIRVSCKDIKEDLRKMKYYLPSNVIVNYSI